MSGQPAGNGPDLSDIDHGDWVGRWLPASWRPYARLCRLDRPIGTWLTLWPCVAALFLSAGGWPELGRFVIFMLGTLLMRSAGCTINDIWDRDIDQHVERTRHRPLTSGQLTLKQAIWFLIAQLALAAALLPFINVYSRWMALALLPIVIIYPLCKRFTNWPQAVLGVCFNWGMLMAWSDARDAIPFAAWALYLGTIAWQLGYDTIYAYIDVRDDQRLGLHSTALRFGAAGKTWIGGFYVVTVLLWGAAGLSQHLHALFYVVLAVIAVHLAWQVVRFDVQRPERGLGLFRANLWTGALLALAALLGTVIG